MRNVFLLLVSLFAFFPLSGARPPASRKPVVVTDKALAVHREGLLIDGHNDLAWQFREADDLDFRKLDITRVQKGTHTDIPRLKKGGVGAQFWAAYVPSTPTEQKQAVKLTLEQIDVILRMVDGHKDTFEMAGTADDILRIRKKGKIACMIGVEGGHSIDSSLGVLRVYYRLGVRYMTLTHADSLEWADSATDKARCGGLSTFGERVVLEMNRLGMLVDISHVSAECMRKVLKVTKAPVIASHSSAYALADHPRNVPDDVLKLVKKNGGVVMVNFYPGFITPEGARALKRYVQAYRKFEKEFKDEKRRKEAMVNFRRENPFPTGSVHHVADHIEHIVKVAGIDHVGIGSDYDGINAVPRQLEDVSCYPVLTQALLDRGYSKEQIHKVMGQNVLRVMRQAEKVAREMKK